LFLSVRPDEPDTHALVGWAQGKRSILTDAAGAEVVAVGAGRPPATVTLARFRAEILRCVESGPVHPEGSHDASSSRPLPERAARRRRWSRAGFGGRLLPDRRSQPEPPGVAGGAARRRPDPDALGRALHPRAVPRERHPRSDPQ